MAEEPRTPEQNPTTQTAILMGTLALIFNAGFYFLSAAYFADRAKRFGAGELARLGEARIEFAIFTIVVAAAAIATAKAPKWVGHGIAIGAGIGSIGAAIASLSSGQPGVLGISLFLVAGAFGLTVWKSLRGSRAGWACLAALCVTYGVMTLFGSPKVRGLLGVGLWIALIVPGLLIVATVALSKLRTEHRGPV